MTDSMKFGPEWLRNMKSDTSLGTPAPTASATIKLAEFRYGREEMLALFDRSILPPDPLKVLQGLYVDKTQLPLALIQMTDEETRMWNRGINSDVAVRLSKPGVGPGVSGSRGGRGGSVDRGRGRARGSYHYSRGLSYEESETTNNRTHLRPYDRTQSGGGWGERNGGDLGDYMATSPRKEYGGGMRGGSADNWRRHRGAGEEDDGWRTARNDKWGRGSSNSWREGENWDRSRGWDDGAPNSHPPPRKPWDPEENNLPEWAMENPSESGGSFDASGAFHGGSHLSDEEERVESQSRPAPHSRQEPHSVSNGSSNPPPHSDSVPSGSEVQNLPGGGGGPLRQSQSATCVPVERSHPLSSSASFSGVNSLTSHPPPPSNSRPHRNEALRPATSTSSSPHLPQPLVDKPPEVAPLPVPAPKPKPHDEDIEQRLRDAADSIVSRLVDEEERDPPAPAAPSPPTAPAPPRDMFWFYQDPQGNVQGPFQSAEMYEWFHSGYFKGTLLVRRGCDERYSPLSELIKLWKGIPFVLDYYLIPPIKNTEPVMPVLDDSVMMQYQLQQRLMMQRHTALAKLSQSEQFNSLPVEQQQQLLAHQAQMEMGMMAPHPPTPNTNSHVLAMLHQLAQYQQLQQQRGGSVPVPQSESMDPMQQLMQHMDMQGHPRAATTPQNTPEDQRSFEQFMAAFRQRQANAQPVPPPPTMESVWGGGTTSPAFPAWSAPPSSQPAPTPPPQSLWADPHAKGIKTEQDILEEQMRVEEKKEEQRKQEELLRLKEEQEKERERQRQIKEEEELERKRKEEEAERKRVQEEEERKKKEAAAAKKAEQDRLRKEEEKKRKEEEKKRKEEEKRKQEEEKKKAEEEKKKLEEDRKKKEDMSRKQNEALKRLQEQQQQQQQQQQRASKAGAPHHTPAPWTAQPVSDPTAGASLIDIQKIERKQQQQLREQQEMLKLYQEKQQKQLENSKSGSNLHFKWVETKSSQPARVKSLAEIQAEEQEQMAKQAEKEKAERMAAAKEVSLPAASSIWAQQNLSWSNSQQNTASVWGTVPAVSNSVSARFWDEVTPATKSTKPPKLQPVQQPQPAAKSQTKIKAKKEEVSVMKLFEKQIPKNSKSDDFNKWCEKSLSSHSNEVDIPTFVDFLFAFESHKEVREYIRMYLGDSKEANDFGTEFIERKSRLLSDQPLQRPEPPPHTNTNQFQEVKGKNKKVKKSKMTKLDSRILGFNVTAAPDRINVGDRDYGEGL